MYAGMGGIGNFQALADGHDVQVSPFLFLLNFIRWAKTKVCRIRILMQFKHLLLCNIFPQSCDCIAEV
jgi:hypothetical protein